MLSWLPMGGMRDRSGCEWTVRYSPSSQRKLLLHKDMLSLRKVLRVDNETIRKGRLIARGTLNCEASAIMKLAITERV